MPAPDNVSYFSRFFLKFVEIRLWSCSFGSLVLFWFNFVRPPGKRSDMIPGLTGGKLGRRAL